MAIISQREAHRLRKRVEELEAGENARLNRWTGDYPSFANICNLRESLSFDVAISAINTARLLKHYVIVKCDGDTIQFYASNLCAKK